jgi:hypothetical protein
MNGGVRSDYDSGSSREAHVSLLHYKAVTEKTSGSAALHPSCLMRSPPLSSLSCHDTASRMPLDE